MSAHTRTNLSPDLCITQCESLTLSSSGWPLVLALIPLAPGLGEPGKEAQAPLAIAALGGLTSTALNMVVPPLFLRYGKLEGRERV